MPLSGTTLKAALKSAILSEIQSAFPLPNGLLAAEITAMNNAQEKLAESVAYGDGPTTVTHITSDAVVAVTSVSGVTIGTGVSGTGVGTVT